MNSPWGEVVDVSGDEFVPPPCGELVEAPCEALVEVPCEELPVLPVDELVESPGDELDELLCAHASGAHSNATAVKIDPSCRFISPSLYPSRLPPNQGTTKVSRG